MKHFFLRFLCLVILSFTVNADEKEILRLKKGEYQYYYLTGDYTTAMNRLAQLKHDGSVQATNPETEEVNLQQAIMLLSLGLHEQAQDLFAEVATTDNNHSSILWFNLAKRWYQLGEYQSAIDSIEQINVSVQQAAQFGVKRIEEAQFIKAASYIELGRHKHAQELIASMNLRSIWTGYARHNFLLAMFEGNTSGRSLSLLIEDALYYLPATDEGRNLKDRINLIAALHFFESGKNRSVEKHLKRISLDGPYTPVALLQLGWNYVEQGKYERALQPWRELQTRFNGFEVDVMESMLGVPHVLELIQAHTQALKTFESSEEKFFAMKQAVINAKNSLEANSWLDDWILQQPDNKWGLPTDLDKTLPLTETTGFLQGLVTTEEFVNKLLQYREFSLLSDTLEEHTQNLKLWLALVEIRERESKVKEAVVTIDDAEKTLSLAKIQLTDLQNYLAQSTNDIFALPSALEDKKIAALSKAAKAIELLNQENKASRDLAPYKKRWSRVRGVFLWQMHEEKPRKQWQLKQELLVLDKIIKRTEVQLLETRLAKQWAPKAWQGLKQRIVKLLTQTSEIKALVEDSKNESKQQLMFIAKSYLTDLSIRINDYLAQTRLSIARLYDDALQASVKSEDSLEKGL